MICCATPSNLNGSSAARASSGDEVVVFQGRCCPEPVNEVPAQPKFAFARLHGNPIFRPTRHMLVAWIHCCATRRIVAAQTHSDDTYPCRIDIITLFEKIDGGRPRRLIVISQRNILKSDRLSDSGTIDRQTCHPSLYELFDPKKPVQLFVAIESREEHSNWSSGRFRGLCSDEEGGKRATSFKGNVNIFNDWIVAELRGSPQAADALSIGFEGVVVLGEAENAPRGDSTRRGATKVTRRGVSVSSCLRIFSQTRT